MRAALPLLVLLCACAGPRPATSARGAGEVLLVAEAWVATPPAPKAGAHLFGQERPAELLGRAAREALAARGWRVKDVRVAHAALPEGEPARLAREAGADAALVLRLRGWDLSSVDALGRAEFDLEWALVPVKDGGGGGWVRPTPAQTAVKLYRSQSDWRSHLRQAAEQAVRELP